MGVSNITENSVVTGDDGGRGMANVIYILYIVGIFFSPAALVGVIMSYAKKGSAAGPFKSHFVFQAKVFWRGLLLLVLIAVSYLVVTALMLVTNGIAAILYIVPAALGIWWLVWTIMAIVKGMSALGRNEVVAA